jgi:perosamine synthetase
VFLGREAEYVADCMSRRRLSMGHYTRKFEEAFADWCGVSHAISCSSGSSALQLALLGLGVGPGHAVLVPALTYVATANAVVHVGAHPVFVDVDPETWCMDPGLIPRAMDWGLPDGTWSRVLLPVHLYGQVADVRALQGGTGGPCLVVEDAAQAHGAVDVYGHQAGALGDVGVFSFYASKLIAAGEGGMVTTDRQDVADLVRRYRGQGQVRTGAYEHDLVAFNYRMTELASAVALAQLETVDEHTHRRAVVMARYRERLAELPVTLQTRDEGAADWMLGLLLNGGAMTAATVGDHLAKAGIESRPFFVPLNRLPMYEELGYECPVAERMYPTGINLPTHSGMTEADVDYVVGQLKEALHEGATD